MRHRVKSNELNIDTGHRKALNRFMATSFIEKGHLTTTLAKAKFLRPYVEKLVTKARKKDFNALKFLKKSLNTRLSIENLLNTIAPKFVTRNGGYTRIVKLNARLGDNAPLARIEWVEKFDRKKVKKDGSEGATEKSRVVKGKTLGKVQSKRSEIKESHE